MAWQHDHLAPVEDLLFKSDLVKVGSFICRPEHPCFAVSEPLDNDVFVMPKKPVWVRRNDDDYRFVEPGAVLMHRAGSTLERRRATAKGERTYWFGVHPDTFVDALERYALPTEHMGGAIFVDPGFNYRLAMLLGKAEATDADRLAVEEDVLNLFFEICKRRNRRELRSRRSSARTARRQQRLVDRARAFLDAHVAENVGLETVADAASTSLYHLCRVFREQTGLTMHAYRTRQRLWYVLDRLMSDRDATLSDIALEQGFSSHSHLSRVFQRQMGVPPSEFRLMAGRA